MNRATLERLNRLLDDKWREVYDARSHLRISIQAITAHSAWKDTCRSLQVWEFHSREPFDFAYPGQMFEETVVVLNPDPNGVFLEMTHETADKILTLGIP